MPPDRCRYQVTFVMSLFTPSSKLSITALARYYLVQGCPHFFQMSKLHLSYEDHSAEDVLFVASAGIFKSTIARKKKRKNPWEAQNMFLIDGAIGLSSQRPKIEPQIRSLEGGWPAQQWIDVIHCNTAQGAKNEREVGRHLPPSEAVLLMKSWHLTELERLRSYSVRVKPEVTLTTMDSLLFFFKRWEQRAYLRMHGHSAGDEVYFSSVSDIVYDPFSTSWCPSPGCMAGSPLWPYSLRSFHRTNSSKDVLLLPYIGKSHVLDTNQASVAEKILGGYAATGIIRPWNFDWGYPSAVSPIFIVARTGPDGKIKYRLIIDYRYVNGSVYSIDLELPTIAEIVANLKKGDLMSKEDMKGGFHQQLLHPSNYHLACIEHAGRLWYFTVTTFGWRDVPGGFQKHTCHIAKSLSIKFPYLLLSKVYIDDFIQRLRQADPGKYEAMLKFITDHGVVLSKSKCTAPSTNCEILGLVVDSEIMKVYVSETKSKYIKGLIISLLNNEEEVTTLSLARIAGRLNSVEPAVPLLALLIRPIYSDIADTLRAAAIRIPGALETERDAEDHYSWKVVPVTISPVSSEALNFIFFNWDIMNGQSIISMLPSWVIRTDASQNGGGITIWSVDKHGVMTFVTSLFIFLDSEERQLSSTAREAIVLSRGILMLHLVQLEGKSVEGVVDNKGLVLRHFKGSVKADIQKCLTRIAQHIITCRATWRGM
jgi:hypothetical protein